MKKPHLMTGRKPLKIPLHRVIDILDDIGELGHADQFKQAVKETGAFVTVHPKTVNIVKRYMSAQDLHGRSQIAADVVGACPPGQDPYHCPFESEA